MISIGFWEMVRRLGLAVLLGGLIGWEREQRGRSAGLRTHILVTMGSTLIMLIAAYIHHQTTAGTEFEAGRIAAGVVTGIGFLGGGAIIKTEDRSRGLTTAASIWISAAVGLAVGCGFYSAALSCTLLTLFVLIVLRVVEHSACFPSK